MATAHGGEVASEGRRRGRRNLSWVTLLCFASQEALPEGTTTTPWETSRRRRKKRTVRPVDDGDLVGTAADSEVMRRGTGEESWKRKGQALRLPGCCFLAPAREHTAMDSSSSGGGGRSKQRHPERTEHQPPRRRRSQSDKSSPSSEASRVQATGDSNSNSNGSRSRGGAEQPRPGAPPAETTRTATNTKPSKTGADGGVGAFGPVVGLSVVIAVSMAGLFGGRLWAVACVCAWLAALSRLRQQTAAGDGAEEAAVDDVEDSTDHKKRVVLRGLLERDRRKAVTAA